MTKSNPLSEIAQLLAKSSDQRFIEDFLKQLLTENEVCEITQRWNIVNMLNQNIPQRKIASKLRSSLCNITRGSKELKKKNSAFAKALARKGK